MSCPQVTCVPVRGQTRGEAPQGRVNGAAVVQACGRREPFSSPGTRQPISYSPAHTKLILFFLADLTENSYNLIPPQQTATVVLAIVVLFFFFQLTLYGKRGPCPRVSSQRPCVLNSLAARRAKIASLSFCKRLGVL